MTLRNFFNHRSFNLGSHVVHLPELSMYDHGAYPPPATYISNNITIRIICIANAGSKKNCNLSSERANIARTHGPPNAREGMSSYLNYYYSDISSLAFGGWCKEC